MILSCELIDNNGQELRKCVHQYIDQWGPVRGVLKVGGRGKPVLLHAGGPHRHRLSPPRGRLPSTRKTATRTTCWIPARSSASGSSKVRNGWKRKLPFKKANLPILVTRDHPPTRTQSAHPERRTHHHGLGAYLAGLDIVRNCMQDEVIKGFMNKALYEEIIPR